MNKRVGLVFAGGGGKGSYQMGVLKALKEYGLYENIQAVSGTSVGALNAALFLLDDIQKAQDIWLEIAPSDVLSFDVEDLLGSLILSGVVRRVTPFLLHWGRKLAGGGIFSQDGLEHILHQKIDLSFIRDSSRPIYATCSHAFRFGPEYFRLNGLPLEKIASILLASSAIPFLFGRVEINGRRYFDGGLWDNVPIAPLYRMKCDVIIVIYLEEDPVIPWDLYPNSTILPIIPKEEQGGFVTGTLDFQPQSVRRRIKAGYEEALIYLDHYRYLLESGYQEGFSFQETQKMKEIGSGNLSLVKEKHLEEREGDSQGIKKEYLEILKGLKEIGERYNFSKEVLEAQDLMDSLRSFYIQVPLLATSHEGKDAFLREYLGFWEEKNHWGSVVSEIHPLTHGQERIEVLYRDGRKGEYPLSFTPKGRLSEVILRRIFLYHEELLNYRDMILLDLDGLDKREGSLTYYSSYLHERTPIILFVEAENLLQYLPSLKDLLSKEREYILLFTGRIPSYLSPLSQKASYVGRVWREEGELAGLKKGLTIMEGIKDRMIQEDFQGEISSLLKELQASLKTLVRFWGLPVIDLQEKKKVFQERERRLKESLLQERELFTKEGQWVFQNKVLQDMEAFLQEEREHLLQQIHQNDLEKRIEEGFFQSVKEHSKEFFSPSLDRFNKLFLTVMASQREDFRPRFHLQKIQARLLPIQIATTGLFFLGPLGILLRRAFLLLTSRIGQGREEERLDELIQQLLSSIREKGGAYMESLSSQYYLLLEKEVNDELAKTYEILSGLTPKLDHNGEEERGRIERDLERLESLKTSLLEKRP